MTCCVFTNLSSVYIPAPILLFAQRRARKLFVWRASAGSATLENRDGFVIVLLWWQKVSSVFLQTCLRNKKARAYAAFLKYNNYRKSNVKLTAILLFYDFNCPIRIKIQQQLLNSCDWGWKDKFMYINTVNVDNVSR